MKRAESQVAVLDGRIRRGERNRQTIVDALLDLVGSGVLRPTAQQVADRAGVGIRTVFRHFSDMDALYRSMDACLEREASPLLLAAVRGESTEERARALVQQRALFFERIAPYKRSGNLLRWRSPFIQDRHANLGSVLRADLTRWLPELERADASVLAAAELGTSFEAWDRLRDDQKLSAKEAAAAMERLLLALLRDDRRRSDR